MKVSNVITYFRDLRESQSQIEHRPGIKQDNIRSVGAGKKSYIRILQVIKQDHIRPAGVDEDDVELKSTLSRDQTR